MAEQDTMIFLKIRDRQTMELRDKTDELLKVIKPELSVIDKN